MPRLFFFFLVAKTLTARILLYILLILLLLVFFLILLLLVCSSLRQEALGWTATLGVKEMCADTWRWQVRPSPARAYAHVCVFVCVRAHGKLLTHELNVATQSENPDGYR